MENKCLDAPMQNIADNSSCDCREMLNFWDDPEIEERDCTSLLSILIKRHSAILGRSRDGGAGLYPLAKYPHIPRHSAILGRSGDVHTH